MMTSFTAPPPGTRTCRSGVPRTIHTVRTGHGTAAAPTHRFGVAVTVHEPCAGAIVFDGAGQLLLIKRGRPPSQGSWSVPGGRCLPGEAEPDACVREVAEETGLAVRVLRLAGRVERDGRDRKSTRLNS